MIDLDAAIVIYLLDGVPRSRLTLEVNALGIWRSYNMFTEDARRLAPEASIAKLLSETGMQVSRVFHCVLIDDFGHMAATGDSIELTLDPVGQLEDLLRSDTSIHIGVASACLFGAIESCPRAPRPYLTFAWPRNVASDMGSELHDHFLSAARRFAADSGADLVLDMIEAPEELEDRLVSINGPLHLDTSVDHEYGFGLNAVLISAAKPLKPPVGPVYTGEVVEIDGYRIHKTNPD